MKRSRFSEEQIIGMLKKQETGMPTVEVCRKHGVHTSERRTIPQPPVLLHLEERRKRRA